MYDNSNNLQNMNWQNIKDDYLPKFKFLLKNSDALLRTLTKPQKKYLKSFSEIIIYFSLRVSNNTFNLLQTTNFVNSREFFIDFILKIYSMILKEELKMTYNLFKNSHKEVPSFKNIRQIIFLARYDGDGPASKPGETLEDFIAYRFFEATKDLTNGHEFNQIVMGNLYNHTWQTGQFIVDNYIYGNSVFPHELNKNG